MTEGAHSLEKKEELPHSAYRIIEECNKCQYLVCISLLQNLIFHSITAMFKLCSLSPDYCCPYNAFFFIATYISALAAHFTCVCARGEKLT